MSKTFPTNSNLYRNIISTLKQHSATNGVSSKKQEQQRKVVMKVVINPLVVTIEVSTLKSAIEQKLCKFKMNTTELPAFIDRILPALKKNDALHGIYYVALLVGLTRRKIF